MGLSLEEHFCAQTNNIFHYTRDDLISHFRFVVSQHVCCIYPEHLSYGRDIQLSPNARAWYHVRML